jgi:hypothetical protein
MAGEPELVLVQNNILLVVTAKDTAPFMQPSIHDLIFQPYIARLCKLQKQPPPVYTRSVYLKMALLGATDMTTASKHKNKIFCCEDPRQQHTCVDEVCVLEDGLAGRHCYDNSGKAYGQDILL